MRHQFLLLLLTSLHRVRSRSSTHEQTNVRWAFISNGIRSLKSSTSFERPNRVSFSILASNSDDDDISKSLFGTSSRKQQKRFISPQINEFTELQISNIFGSSGNSNKFVPLSLAGMRRPQSKERSSVGNITVDTIFLSSLEDCQIIANGYKQYLKSNDNSNIDQTTTALPIPIPPSMSTNAMKLLTQTYTNQPLSKSVLLSQNSLFINRDNGLFDNLPWSTWSIDPNLQERDAANNVVQAKFTMGKRVAYQRFMGKDWQGRSLSLGNLAKRVRYLLEKDDDGTDDDGVSCSGNENYGEDDDAMLSLSQRLLQLEIKEAQMEIAECEQSLAISKTQSAMDKDDDIIMDESSEATAKRTLEKARERLQVAESSLQQLDNAMTMQSDESNSSSFLPFSFPWDNDKKKKDAMSIDNNQSKSTTQSTLILSILDKLSEQDNPPPYRGAIGYPAKIDSKKEMFEESILPYSSPYELLLDIIHDQLNSDVISCVLEPTSLLEGNLVLGGALLLKRRGVTKSTTLAGESVSYSDDDDDLGNDGVLPRSMYVVECFVDEAVGMAMAFAMPLFVEEAICNRAGRVSIEMDLDRATIIKMEKNGENGGEDGRVKKDVESLSFVNRMPPIRPLDESHIPSQLEGEKISSERDANSVRMPLTTNPQLFASPNQVPTPSSSSTKSSSVFSTFNPVKTLDEYDTLTDDGKARLLLKLESFTDPLPRPRAVRTTKTVTSNSGNSFDDDGSSPPSVLDEILLPLVDESVRRQYRIRDAERRNDYNEATALRDEVSPRQTALERANNSREEGFDDEATRLEEEAELYKALRADVTQDEGSYSRYLDRDEWYERETQARIKRMDKSKFGTLLDGIDLP